MAFELIVNTAASSSDLGQSVTTPAVDTTGADLIVIEVSDLGPGSTTLTDSKGNTWTPLTAETSANIRARLYYAVNPIVGSDHTFIGTGNLTSYPSIYVVAFSGSHATPVDQENGDQTASGSSLMPGSVTPSEDNELVITGLCTANAGMTPFTINGAFTITNQADLSPANAFGGALAYLIQTSAAAASPEWTFTGGSGEAAAVIASFKAASGARKFILTHPA